ncbi:MAG TPA: ATP-binding protein [Kiritimatiellia bacterium]|nr:ATP-binding protein [Kiritimatiellia bacterium]HMP33189.1 ATP-binding protein [Kiritimatiellia bacterium]
MSEKTSQQELKSLAHNIQQWQEAKHLSDAALRKRFPDIGSDRTYKRILAGDFDELDVEVQLAKYRAVWALIETIGEDAGVSEDFYDDLSPVVQLRRSLLETFHETGNARFILVQGDTGSGKTSAAKALIAKYGQRLLFVELTDVMSDSPSNFLGLIMGALGMKNLPSLPMQRFELVVRGLSQGRRCLIIDELHHAGPRILNTIKALVNSTPGEFVGLTMPTLWARLERGNYEECRQLVGNRLAERIKLAAVTRADMMKFVGRRLPGLNGETAKAITLLEQYAPGRGNLGFVRDACRRAREMYDGEKITLEDFARAVSAEVESR